MSNTTPTAAKRGQAASAPQPHSAVDVPLDQISKEEQPQTNCASSRPVYSSKPPGERRVDPIPRTTGILPRRPADRSMPDPEMIPAAPDQASVRYIGDLSSWWDEPRDADRVDQADGQEAQP